MGFEKLWVLIRGGFAFKKVREWRPCSRAWLLVAALWLLGGFYACSEEWRLARVIDGDTIRARRAGVEEKVRLKGVDAPEIAHPDYGQFKDEPYGPESRECLARVLDGHTLRLDFQTGGQVPERDQYGRLLAYVWAGETQANAQIIKEGCARAFHKYPHPRRDEFVELEKEARKARRGLWKDGPTSPSK